MTERGAGSLGPDEKVCPYCAEVIKAAAIKCRFCHSDLPVEEPVPDVETVETQAGDHVDWRAVTPPMATPPTVGAERVSRPAPAWLRDPWVLGLAVLCVVLGVVFATLVITSRPGDLEVAGNGQVTDVPFRSSAMSTAAADAGTILSYDYKTLASDQKDALALLTPKFAKEYESVMKDTGAKATSAKLTQKATVLTSSLTSITKSRATVLMFVNTVTTAEGSTRQQLFQYRVRMKLERKDGDWAVSDMVRF